LNILIAEDDPVGRLTLQAMLKAAGYQVTPASDGQEALDAWRLTAARVIISDWMMPEMDGLELCRRIRDARTPLYTYFILLTGRSGKESFLTEVTAIAAGNLHTCALLEDKTVVCWGDNNVGQLGDNTTTQRTDPVPVRGLS